MNRRTFLKYAGAGSLAIWGVTSLRTASAFGSADSAAKPNVILFMTDDQGWGDVGFNGNREIVTPNLDRVCAQGTRLYHFFAGGPVCSPTRGTVLSGRHYWRYGIWSANAGRLPTQEYTIPQVLKDSGYTCGHFGKWHLGSPHPDYTGKGGGGKPDHLARPEWFGYDKHFITHHAVKTWDPFGPDGSEIDSTDNPYWEDGKRVTERLTGDDSRIIMDRAIPFIESAAAKKQPFLTVIWTHTPHAPLEAGPEYVKMYEERGLNPKKIKYYGAITALDEQVGRLEKKLKELGLWENTMWWFCSDNGPASHIRDGGYGSTDGMRGKKAHLFNGGVCVPAFVVWPGHVQPGATIKTPMSTLDYLPTLFSLLGIQMPDGRPLDGENAWDIITGKTDKRKKPIPFRHSGKNAPALCLIDGQYKYYTNFDTEKHDSDLLYDFCNDRGEEHNLIGQKPEVAQRMREYALEFLASCKRSYEGADYPPDSGYTPLGRFKEMPNNLWLPPELGKGKSKKKTGDRSQRKKKKNTSDTTD